MEYTIESKQGMQGEAMLSVLIPEEQVDEKALYTIESDRPEFLVPFHYRYVDGSVELIYTPQKRLSLLFFAGSRPQQDYIDLWKKIVRPLERCEDWFMRRDCFVMDLQYVFLDKDTGEISYLYVPAKQAEQGTAGIRLFLQRVAKQFTTDNAGLTVRVLESLLEERPFQPEEFLQMLAPFSAGHTVQSVKAAAVPPAAPQESRKAEPVIRSVPETPPAPAPKPEKPPVPQTPGGSHLDDGMDDMPWGGEEEPKPKKQKQKKERPVKEKPVREKKPLFSFGKKQQPEQADVQPLRGGSQLEDIPLAAPPQPDYAPPQAAYHFTERVDSGETQICFHTPQLRYIGGLNHEPVILLPTEEGKLFCIGRYDVSVGMRQSDFEFPPDTPAVSRKHAAIRLRGGVYYITDLNSRAGTFVNEQKLSPNVERPLAAGDRVSFGGGGANYVFEP